MREDRNELEGRAAKHAGEASTPTRTAPAPTRKGVQARMARGSKPEWVKETGIAREECMEEKEKAEKPEEELEKRRVREVPSCAHFAQADNRDGSRSE
ncbi:hypothetical protein ERJ75_001111200 [Trypanosoma vivax]|nr:hypothetical protein ERJ75_001111200 [Trypanosoma vivax]